MDYKLDFYARCLVQILKNQDFLLSVGNDRLDMRQELQDNTREIIESVEEND
jgi:hypothetical protein